MTIPLSSCRRAGDFLFLSGQLGLDGAKLLPGGIAAETRQTIHNISSVLAVHHAGLADVVKSTVYLASMADWPTMNEVYAELFHGPYPARSVVEAALAADARVEIEVVAYAPVPYAAK